MYIILPLLAIGCAFALPRILGRTRFLPHAPAMVDVPRVSIIIPARDEEANIADLLDSIAIQSTSPHEVIVVDDGSSDRTAAVASRKGATVIKPGSLPEGWKGKPWACQQGAEASTGDWLLFLDADVRLLDGAFGKIAALTSEPNAVFSICPFHRIRHGYEEMSAFFNVTMLTGINAFGRSPSSGNDEALFGQSLLISKEHYEEVGGHERVRDEVLENFRLSFHLRKKGISTKCFMGRGDLEMRMFPNGFSELEESWKKGFSGGAAAAAPRALLLTSIWISGAMLAVVGVLASFSEAVSPVFRITSILAYFVYVRQCLRAFRLAGSFSVVNALFFPVSLFFYQSVFFTSLIERRLGMKTQWKGRDVD